MARIRVLVTCISISIFSLYASQSGSEKGVDPTQALDMLMQGNERFVNFEAQHPRQMNEQRQKTAKNGQKPFVSILSCSDSRVPLEILFDVGIGDIFVVRVAGNIADKCEIGSLEWGASRLGTRLIMVMGHTKCDAVIAAVKKQPLSANASAIIDKIALAVEKTKAESGAPPTGVGGPKNYLRLSEPKDTCATSRSRRPPTKSGAFCEAGKGLSEDAIVLKAIRANIWQSVENILRNSEDIRNLVLEGKVKVVGALYDIQAGTVTNMGVHFNQAKILADYKPAKK